MSEALLPSVLCSREYLLTVLTGAYDYLRNVLDLMNSVQIYVVSFTHAKSEYVGLIVSLALILTGVK